MNRIFKHSRRADDRERGATAMLVAVSLMVLIGFAAIAVDSGIAYADRREQASAADVGALAALQFAKTTLPTTNCGALSDEDRAACRGAEEAMAVVEGTLPGRYPLASWQACTDPDKPAEYTQGSTISPCINFTHNLEKSRVVLPGTEVATTFARVIGFNSISVGAFAEAGLEMDIIGGVMPFAVGPSGAGSDQACFFAGDTPLLNADPCSSGTQGNYGKLNLRTYGNDKYGTPLICSGSTAERIAINIATGSDHPLEPEWRKGGVVNDNTNCAIMSNEVDEVETWTGNAAGAISEGLFEGITTPALEGRLLCKGPLSTDQADEDYPLGTYESTDCKTVLNIHPEALDHSPLWDYIASGIPGTGAGEKCAPGQLKDRASMAVCLDWWGDFGDKTKPLFTDEIVTSPRFGGVPILNSDPGSGFSAYLITEFRPVYIETLYLGCSGPVKCSVVHSPGENSAGACPTPITAADSSCGWPGTGVKVLEAITSYVLTLDMLPADLAAKFPYQEGTIVYNLSR
jgi:hypothetical protein